MDSLEKLIEDLKGKGFDIGKFEYNDGMTDLPAALDYTMKVGGIELPDLGLSTQLVIGVTTEIPTTIPNLESLQIIKLKFRPYVFFKSFREEDSELIEESGYRDLPDRLREEHDLLQRIDYHITHHPAFRPDERPQTPEGLRKLYGKLVNQGNLRWFNLMGENFPYVVTTFNATNDVGNSYHGLYFVATDVANEHWKEAIVAYHEFFCQDRGHEFALSQEIKLAKFLGKEKEYQTWRVDIHNGLK